MLPKLKIIKQPADSQDKCVEVDSRRLTETISSLRNGLVQVRWDAEFNKRAFFLSSYYEWVIGTDSTGAIVLVPLKK